MRLLSALLGMISVALSSSCSSSNDANSALPREAGGSASSGFGGTVATGGSPPASTSNISGGADASGGVAAAGNSTAGRGSTAVASSTGGRASTGGTAAEGGTAGNTNAGTRAIGGTTGGGATSTGGALGIGGLNGGTNTSGGTTVSSMRPASGGTAASGGLSATGGSQSSGGTNTGGSASTTATTSVGGVTATGGTKAAGGSTAKVCATTAATLKAAADCTGRLIGAALSTEHLSETAYATAARDFNYVTPENEMKWSSNEPNRGQFSFGAGDQIVNFANTNGMKVKGHALVWHNQLPAWASSLGNATDTRAAMLAHVKGVVEHYKGKVHAWDVVNEAVSLDGTGMRDSPFYRYLGETFIDEAFEAARQADSNAKLYYNDYNCEGLSPKANKVYDLVKGMRERGVPFDGVGLQMHYGEPNEAVPVADFVANMQRYADLDLDILISEMDVHVCAGLSPTQQQAIYHDIIAACVAQPRCTAITFWGVTDKYSWLNDEPDLGCSTGEKPLGLLWDDAFKKKPAYTGALNALLGL